MMGGGLGAQPALAHIVHEFLPEDQLIPYIESVIRVFDRYGERNNRNKARFKYLIQKIGLDEVLQLVEEERTANKSKTFVVDRYTVSQPEAPANTNYPKRWNQITRCATNTGEQPTCLNKSRKDTFGVYIKVEVGDIPTDQAL